MTGLRQGAGRPAALKPGDAIDWRVPGGAAIAGTVTVVARHGEVQVVRADTAMGEILLSVLDGRVNALALPEIAREVARRVLAGERAPHLGVIEPETWLALALLAPRALPKGSAGKHAQGEADASPGATEEEDT